MEKFDITKHPPTVGGYGTWNIPDNTWVAYNHIYWSTGNVGKAYMYVVGYDPEGVQISRDIRERENGTLSGNSLLGLGGHRTIQWAYLAGPIVTISDEKGEMLWKVSDQS